LVLRWLSASFHLTKINATMTPEQMFNLFVQETRNATAQHHQQMTALKQEITEEFDKKIAIQEENHKKEIKELKQEIDNLKGIINQQTKDIEVVRERMKEQMEFMKVLKNEIKGKNDEINDTNQKLKEERGKARDYQLAFGHERTKSLQFKNVLRTYIRNASPNNASRENFRNLIRGAEELNDNEIREAVGVIRERIPIREL